MATACGLCLHVSPCFLHADLWSTGRYLSTGRYQRFYNLQRAASFLAIDNERLNVPKGHQLLHMITHMLLYGAVDLARLNWWEARHVQAVKDPVQRTRQNENSFLFEMHKPVSRSEVFYAATGYESSPNLRVARAQHAPAHANLCCTGSTCEIYRSTCVSCFFAPTCVSVQVGLLIILHAAAACPTGRPCAMYGTHADALHARHVSNGPALPRNKPKKVPVHKNRMKGMWAPHTLRNLAKERGLPRTAEGYSAVGVYSPRSDGVPDGVPVDADVSHLATALQKYWQTEGIEGGVYPTGATIPFSAAAST